jgi:hypothetical protein
MEGESPTKSIDEFLKPEEEGTAALARKDEYPMQHPKTRGEPLDFTVVMEEVNHEKCDDYPDLSMTRVERDKI